MVEKNTQGLSLNCASVEGEIDEIHRRLTKSLKDRTDYLRNEIDRYLTTEARNLTTLKSQLEQELLNIQANCELADKHVNENVEWDDCELMDTKEIFLKTVDFIRNFEYEQSDYTRRARFIMSHDPNTLVMNVANYGELAINMPQPFGVMGSNTSSGTNTGGLQPPSGPGLMRSKSDHRLATQFRQQEEQYYGRAGADAEDALNGRKFGERPQGRYGRRNDEYEDDSTESRRPSRYRSRFTRHLDNPDDDPESSGGRSVRFSEESPSQANIPRKERERVLDTEDVSKGPLSGITRLSDSPRVMKRLQETENKDKKAKDPKPVTPVAPVAGAKPPVAGQPAKKTSRQVSEDDEIAKIKKQNKAEASTASAGAATPETRTSADRTTAHAEEPARRPSEVRDRLE